MKKIIILGAGVYQLPLIKKAKENGLFTIVVSIPGKYQGFQFADKIYYTDTRDSKAIIDLYRETLTWEDQVEGDRVRKSLTQKLKAEVKHRNTLKFIEAIRAKRGE